MYLRSLLLLCVCGGMSAVAAPAPFPKSGGKTDEVVFEAKTEERARLLTVYLRGKHVKEAMRRGGHAWPLDSLRIDVSGTRVRIQFNARSARSTMLDLIDILTTQTVDEGGTEDQLLSRRGRVATLAEYSRRVKSMRLLGARGGVTKSELDATEATQAHYEFQVEPLKLHAGPRRVR